MARPKILLNRILRILLTVPNSLQKEIANETRWLNFSLQKHEVSKYRKISKDIVLNITQGNLFFDVFFFIDGSPYILLFGVKAENFSFEIEVKNGFVIDPRLDTEDYKKLCQVLGLKFDPDNPFNPWNFFAEFNKHIPVGALAHQKVEPHHIAQYKNIAEEADKIYFVGWRDNSKWGTKVQPSNLDKTKNLLGERAYKRCKQKNISSCWTDKKEHAIDFTLPD